MSLILDARPYSFKVFKCPVDVLRAVDFSEIQDQRLHQVINMFRLEESLAGISAKRDQIWLRNAVRVPIRSPTC